MAEPLKDLYLSLLKRALMRYGMEGDWRYEPYRNTGTGPGDKLRRGIQAALRTRGFELTSRVPVDLALREEGRDWPETAETMVGVARLNQLQKAVEDVIVNDIPGDLIETGVWRGGSCILMRGVLAAHGVADRTVWVADSFEGLPKPDPGPFEEDGMRFWQVNELAISQEEVEANFAKYGLLDEQVRFLKGWFKDTLPTAPIDRLAVLRLDGDLYESTIQALEALYRKVSPGGYVIIDDYGNVKGCQAAVTDFRHALGITAPLVRIDFAGVYWQVESS